MFAIGVLWLLPSITPAAPLQVKPKRKANHNRRRSAPPILQTSIRRPALPSLLGPTKSPFDSPRTRHVYFADSPTVQTPPALSRRYTTPAEDLQNIAESLKEPAVSTNVIPLDTSPRSSSSTLDHTTQSADYHSAEVSTNIESDRSSCSSRPSISVTTRFPCKVKASWNRKSSRNKPVLESGGEATRKSVCSVFLSIVLMPSCRI